MAVDPNKIAATILAQTIVMANQAAESAAAAAKSAGSITEKADINSPTFIGVPRAPTAEQNNNSTQLATTAYLDRLFGVPTGLATLDASGKIPSSQIPPVSITAVFVVNSEVEMLALPAAVGNSAIRTDEANAQYILTALPASTLGNWIEVGIVPVLSVAGLTGAISAADLTAQLIDFVGDSGSGGTSGDVPAPAAGDAAAGKFLFAGGGFTQIPAIGLADGFTGTGTFARADSPTFLGTPGGPTAAVDTNTGQFATTAFVLAQASSSGDGVPAMDGIAARGTSTHYARADHIHPTDTSLAPLASPSFTGAITLGTNAGAAALVNINAALANSAGILIQSAGTTKWQIYRPGTTDKLAIYSAALTANVFEIATNGQSTFNYAVFGPTAAPGTNTTQLATTAFVAAIGVLKANLASPTFTGVPAAPTAAPGTNTTQLANTAFVTAAIAALSPAPIPSSSTLPIGWSGLLYCSVASVADGETTAGSNLRIPQFDVATPSAPTYVSGGALQTGTWKNITGATGAIGYVMLWVRTA